MVRCPHCGRELTKHERICFHCEQDVSKAVDEAERPSLPTPQPYQIKKDFKKYKETAKKILSRLKKQPKIEAYCVKCKKKVNINNPQKYIMKNDRVAVKGICPYCSCKVFRILGKR